MVIILQCIDVPGKVTNLSFNISKNRYSDSNVQELRIPAIINLFFSTSDSSLLEKYIFFSANFLKRRNVFHGQKIGVTIRPAVKIYLVNNNRDSCPRFQKPQYQEPIPSKKDVSSKDSITKHYANLCIVYRFDETFEKSPVCSIAFLHPGQMVKESLRRG